MTRPLPRTDCRSGPTRCPTSAGTSCSHPGRAPGRGRQGVRRPAPARAHPRRPRHPLPGRGRPPGPRCAARPAATRWRWPTGARCCARLVEALGHPDVDGVLGTPDVVEELLLLGALEGKVVIGSMNRGGLDGASWTMDDRFTGYDAASIADCRLEGGKMLLRIDDTDAGTARDPRGLRAARSPSSPPTGSMAMVEPLPYHRDDDGSLRLLKDAALARPRGHGRLRARHDERLHLAEDAGLRRPRGGLRRDHAAVRRARRRPRPRPGRGPRVVGPRAAASRRSAASSSAGPCSTRRTATWRVARSTRPRAGAARRDTRRLTRDAGTAPLGLCTAAACRPAPVVDAHARDAGWDWTGLRVLRLAAGEPDRVATGDTEAFVLPLAGSLRRRRCGGAGRVRPAGPRLRVQPRSPTSATSAATAC